MNFKTGVSLFIFALLNIVFFLLFPETSPQPSIAFVHLGPSLPEYFPSAVAQARLFNPDVPIYVIADEAAIQNSAASLQDSKVKWISSESLPKSKAHETFLATSRLSREFRNGFWLFAMERFFYLASLMKEYNLSDVFHLENDVMLYTNLKELLPIFKKNYKNMMGATFDNDERCIPGFLYIANALPLQHFTGYMANRRYQLSGDMKGLSRFWRKHRGKWIDSLPIVVPEYAKDHPLVSAAGWKGTNPEHFSRHFGQFHSIFDAAAIGQYLGGIDPWNGPSLPGFVNESCIFNPQKFQFVWEIDNEGRKVPVMKYGDHICKINNLHIHSKNLKSFESVAKFPQSP